MKMMTKTKTIFTVSAILPILALTLALCVSAQPMFSQTASQSTQPDPQQNDQNTQTAASQKTFNGKIMKAGDKLVLTAADTTYQLDDQQKAQDFLNKSVKVTGVLDASTGTIRVSAIDLA